MDKFSYGLGMNIGQNLASMGVSTLEFADFVKGMQDVLSGKQTEITVVEAQNAINDFFNKVRIKLCSGIYSLTLHIILTMGTMCPVFVPCFVASDMDILGIFEHICNFGKH